MQVRMYLVKTAMLRHLNGTTVEESSVHTIWYMSCVPYERMREYMYMVLVILICILPIRMLLTTYYKLECVQPMCYSKEIIRMNIKLRILGWVYINLIFDMPLNYNNRLSVQYSMSSEELNNAQTILYVCLFLYKTNYFNRVIPRIYAL